MSKKRLVFAAIETGNRIPLSETSRRISNVHPISADVGFPSNGVATTYWLAGFDDIFSSVSSTITIRPSKLPTLDTGRDAMRFDAVGDSLPLINANREKTAGPIIALAISMTFDSLMLLQIATSIL